VDGLITTSTPRAILANEVFIDGKVTTSLLDRVGSDPSLPPATAESQPEEPPRARKRPPNRAHPATRQIEQLIPHRWPFPARRPDVGSDAEPNG